MPYIGKAPVSGGFHKLDALTASATATYALTLGSAAYYPETANQLLVSLNGVIQAPQDSFTVSGSNLIFDSALTASDSIDFVVALGDVLGVGSVTDGAVTTSKLANQSVTMAKLATSGTLPALDGSNLTGVGVAGISSSSTSGTAVSIDANNIVTMPSTPIFSGTHSAATNISSQVLTSSNFYDTIWVNQGNHFNTSTGRFTIPIAGVYRMFFRSTSASTVNVRLRKNGNTINEAYGASSGTQTVSSEAVINCVVGDYLDIEANALPSNGGSQHKQVTIHLLG